MRPLDEDSSFLGHLLSYRAVQGGIMDACSMVAAHGPLRLPLPAYAPTTLSPSKWKAGREAPKCSWGRRPNQTFCRSLVRSLVICLWRTCGRERPSHIWEGLPDKDPITVLKTCAPGRRLEFPGSVAQPPCCPSAFCKDHKANSDFGAQVLFVKITRPWGFGAQVLIVKFTRPTL